MLGIFLWICVESLATSYGNFTQQNINRFTLAFFGWVGGGTSETFSCPCLSFKYGERTIDLRISNNPCAQEIIGTNIYGHRFMHSPWYWYCGYLISCFSKSLSAYWTKWAFGIQQYNFVRHQKFMIGRNISVTSKS